jgi:hypothetical protein
VVVAEELALALLPLLAQSQELELWAKETMVVLALGMAAEAAVVQEPLGKMETKAEHAMTAVETAETAQRHLYLEPL